MYVTGYSREKANGVGRIVNYLEPGSDTVSIQVTLTRRFLLFSADIEGSWTIVDIEIFMKSMEEREDR